MPDLFPNYPYALTLGATVPGGNNPQNPNYAGSPSYEAGAFGGLQYNGPYSTGTLPVSGQYYGGPAGQVTPMGMGVGSPTFDAYGFPSSGGQYDVGGNFVVNSNSGSAGPAGFTYDPNTGMWISGRNSSGAGGNNGGGGTQPLVGSYGASGSTGASSLTPYGSAGAIAGPEIVSNYHGWDYRDAAYMQGGHNAAGWETHHKDNFGDMMTATIPGGSTSMMSPPNLNNYNLGQGNGNLETNFADPSNGMLFQNWSNGGRPSPTQFNPTPTVPTGVTPPAVSGTWSSAGMGAPGASWNPTSTTPVPGFSANGPTAPGTGGLNPGLPFNPTMFSHLDDIYGKGFGNMLGQFMSSGAGYNPAVGQAFINQMWPDVMRGNAQILDAFGDTGQRFSSTAALAQGDYFDRVMRSFGGIQAGMYENSVNRQMQLITSLMNPFQSANAADLEGLDYLNMAMMFGNSSGLFDQLWNWGA